MGDNSKAAHQAMSDMLTDLESYFVADVQLSIFARHTTISTAHMLVSNDTIEDICRGLMELKSAHDTCERDTAARPPRSESEGEGTHTEGGGAFALNAEKRARFIHWSARSKTTLIQTQY